MASETLEKKFGTKVLINRVDFGFLNRIIVDGFVVFDQNQKKMLSTTRLSASLDILPLLEGRIQISSAQIFGLDAHLYRANVSSPINCQFLIDSLSSKDSSKKTDLDLRIASLVIRNGSVQYDQLDVPNRNRTFSLSHIKTNHISSHIIIYELTNNSIDAELKTLSLKESSGLEISNLAFLAHVSGLDKDTPKRTAEINRFKLRLPNSEISFPNLSASCKIQNGKFDLSDLHFDISLNSKHLSLKDLQPFFNVSVESIPTLSFALDLSGDNHKANGAINFKAVDRSLNLSSSFYLKELYDNPRWKTNPIDLYVSQSFISELNKVISLPKPVLALGNCTIKGNAEGTKSYVNTDLKIATSNVGNVGLNGTFDGKNAKLKLETNELALDKLIDSPFLGNITANGIASIHFVEKSPSNSNVKLNINKVMVKDYTYHNLTIKADYSKLGKTDVIDADITSHDENLQALINAKTTLNSGKLANIIAEMKVEKIVPERLNLTDTWGNSTFSFALKSNISGSTIDNINGFMRFDDFEIDGAHKSLISKAKHNNEGNVYYPESSRLNNLTIATVSKPDGRRNTTVSSDFCNIDLEGRYNISSIPESFMNIIRRSLSTIPGINSFKKTGNDFTLNAKVKSLDFIKVMTGTDVSLNGNAEFKGYLNDRNGAVNFYAIIPSIKYNNYQIDDFKFLTWRPDKSLSTTLSSTLTLPSGKALDVTLNANANNEILKSNIAWKSHSKNLFEGNLNTIAESFTTSEGKPGVQISIQPSDIHIGDSILHLHSQGITYSAQSLTIDNFAFENQNQHIYINGRSTTSMTDSLVADLKNVNVEYIMNLVNFHSVDFAGFASGKVVARQLFTKPDAKANLVVQDFRLENGRLGDLFVDAKLNNYDQQIDIQGVAKDSVSYLGINGYVSPQKNGLDLNLDVKNTRLEFIHTFCSSFMSSFDVYGNGNLRLYGPFSGINLEGEMVAHGGVDISTLNCHYTIPNDTVKLVEGEIYMKNQPLHDIYGHNASISGSIHHRHLSHLTYDFDINARNLLAYNFKESEDNSFSGTAFMTGDCNISGRSSDIKINVNGTAEKGSLVVYNASSPDDITNQDFITWHSSQDNFIKPSSTDDNSTESENKKNDIRTNIHMNFLVNVNEGSTLRILMDKNTGDYIDFHGNGSLRAQYYNKGSFDIFGNYNINSGLYHMTIQNFITRDFDFLPGSVMNFNGAPFSATLNLKAQYVLNSVPLSGLNIGQSFSNNNVHVNCLLDITGTAGAPQVDFSMDLPTVSNDVKQMIYSLVNSEEEMKQQVVYLLAVGRFYSQGSNNAETQSTNSSQTNQAMQSILSGTISQQLASALGSALNNNNWTIGANISPGDEGFNNAEYEGIFSGSLLNNRLLVNGQVGYRDNANTTSQEFIGDFDIRYLLKPNGNVAVKVYNQANDRYFTRNSLNTQGVGLVLKTDFNTWRELLKKRLK